MNKLTMTAVAFAASIALPVVVAPAMAQDITILFPDDVCDRRTWHNFGSFGVHHMAGSWRGRQNFLALRLTRLWEARMLRRILADGKVRGKTRDRKL